MKARKAYAYTLLLMNINTKIQIIPLIRKNKKPTIPIFFKYTFILE